MLWPLPLNQQLDTPTKCAFPATFADSGAVPVARGSHTESHDGQSYLELTGPDEKVRKKPGCLFLLTGVPQESGQPN
jgi:hypothetical protein